MPAEILAPLLRMMWLYPNYRVDSRGPSGCLMEAIELLDPPTAERLRNGTWRREMYGHIDPTNEESCPWCGYVDPDSWEWKEGYNEAECAHCEHPITVNVAIDVIRRITKRQTGDEDAKR